MAATSKVTYSFDTDVKESCEALYDEIGLSLKDAIFLFMKESLRVGGLPFDLRISPDEETLEAIAEARRLSRDPDAKRYTVSEALEELKK